MPVPPKPTAAVGTVWVADVAAASKALVRQAHYLHTEHTDECLREQLDELIERMVIVAHTSNCGCPLCYKYEVIAQILLDLF